MVAAALLLLAQGPFRPQPSTEPRPKTVEMPAFPPKTAFEPPMAAAAKSLADSTAASPKDLLTLAEKTNYAETARYAESVALARRLEKASPWVKVVTFGTTPQGREMIATIVSKDRTFTPEAAKKSGKAIVMLQSCIHPGEVDGKEASEMLIRDIAVTKKFASWLDHAIFVNIPVFNVDGHERFSAFNRINQDGPREMGFRVTAQRLNLNRDFLKADAPEMRAWLKLWNAWLPDFFLDNHVTDGMDFQYDITIDIPQYQEVWATVGAWTRERYLPYLNDTMATDGHIMGPYGGFVDRADPTKGFASSSYSPRFSTGYTAIQNRPGLLVETHSLKSFKTRTWAHYDVMRRSIEAVVRDPKALMDAVRAADKAVAELAGTSTEIYLDGKRSDESVPFTFKALRVTRRPSDLAGGPIAVYEKEPQDIATRLFNKTATTLGATAPAGYIVPVEWTEVIDRLALHGIRTERLPRDVKGDFTTWHFFKTSLSPMAFEGRVAPVFEAKKTTVSRTVPAGSVWVPLNQRTARVALNLLEPEAPDSLLRWGFLHSIFEQKEYFGDYIMEPIAREMAKLHPELKREFDAKVASDQAFARNPQARVRWWFERSPYYEDDKDVYPILRVERKSW
ncbi:MAG: M14 family metallopeptidase [Bryobacteraceae bacterium]|nr:M14 family metallopeptidase [Bryobacteraceae bacterium]